MTQNAPIHIVHYISRIDLAAGGVVRAVLDMTELTASAGNKVTVVTAHDADVPDHWRDIPDRLHIVATTRGGLIAKHNLPALKQRIASADVVHLHTPWETANVQMAKIARKHNKPYILTVHGMLDDWCMTQRGLKKKLYLALAGKRLLENAAAVHCSAQAELDQSKKYFPNGRGIIVPNLLAMDDYETLPGPDIARDRWTFLKTDKPVLLFLSRVHEKKGIEHLINAVPILRDRHIDPVVVIAGTGDELYTGQLKDLAASLGVAQDVHFVGHVGGTEKLSLYEAADVFVLPTSQENFGFVYFESLACRTPVITTRGTDTWPELLSSGAVAITDPVTAEHLASDVQQMLRDPDALQSMGDTARSWVFGYLDQGRVLQMYDAMYRRTN